MHNCIIVEDEDRLSEALQIMLQRLTTFKVNIIGIAKTVAESVQLIDNLKPSLLFMDINLKDGNAFNVLESLQHRGFHLVFTTAFDEHAVQAFRYSALDYLLKPISMKMLEEVLQRIEQLESRYINKIQITHAAANLTKAPDTLVLSTQEGMYVVALTDIVRCETSGSYTTFFLEESRKIVVSRSLASFEEILCPPHFLRVHQSHLINVSKVKLYEKRGVLVMKDDIGVPVARSKKDTVMAMLNP